MMKLRFNLLKSRFFLSFHVRKCCSMEALTINEVLEKYSGMSRFRTEQMIKTYKLHQTTPAKMLKVIKLCEEFGYSKDDILSNAIVLKKHPSTLDQYYTAMSEGGFCNIGLKTVAKFRSLYNEKLSKLKQSGLIDRNTDVAASFIKHLSPCPDGFSVKISKDMTWSAAHFAVQCPYLKWRLNATSEQIERLYELFPTILRKSFKYTCQNINFAEQELGFSQGKILKNGYIMTSYPKYWQQNLEKYSEIAGVSLKKAMVRYPKFMTTSPDSIDEIFALLRKHNISENKIAKRLNIFQLSPKTVEFRIQEMKRVADLKVLTHNPNSLRLVVHQNRAKSRLSFLKQLKLRCSTVRMLAVDDVRFDAHIREGRDVNSFLDMHSFLKGTLSKDPDEFDKTLRKHPYYLQVPLASMEESYNYLISERFTVDVIAKAVYILLYPKEKLQSAFKQVRQYESERGKTFSQITKLNLALYFIEKDHHFTGDGVWVKTEGDEDALTHVDLLNK